MKTKLKRLASTLGAFGGLAGIVFVTALAVNKHISIAQFAVDLIVSSGISLICIAYISRRTERGVWID